MNESIYFYFEGDEFFAGVREAVATATKSVHVEIYTLASDPVGKGLAELLVKKAKEGVEIKLIYDAIGCRNTSGDLFDFLESGGVEIKKYNSILPPGRHFRRRDHRKMVIVDGMIGFIGGFNFAAEYSRAISGIKVWRDTGIRMTDDKLVLTLSFLFTLLCFSGTIR